MKRSLIPLVIVLVALAATSAAVLAMTRDGGPATDDAPPILSDEAIEPNECNLVHNIDACDEGVGESACDPLPLRSDCGIDPDECNLVHNIDACTDEELDAGGILEESVGAGDKPPVRSDEGIDPNECNLVHNINACTDEELDAGGILEGPPVP